MHIYFYYNIYDNYKNSNFVLATCNNSNSRNLSKVMRKNNLILNDGKVRNNVSANRYNSKHMRSSHIRKEEHKDEIDEKKKFNNKNLEKTNNKKNNYSIINMNHCILSKILTRGELYHALNGVEEFTSRIDLFNIWNQELGINSDTVDILMEDLSLHLYNDLCHFDYVTLRDNESCHDV
ncbi:Plasmodium exported protein, unknown function, fragment [Plasmodium reichenowi]|uniref:Putative exported protein n=1 Tax=Plasmodium reichenowi TaxID=5854 RepID=A0A060RX00_PLARE|nr:putative exported protein [Plasmodium reichenowi]KYN93190.1 putative exported protein [Plasmodium reichenowi]CDO65801.1 Plasmodium exported protein, unknown function, fragment [Plasmodium reichenowi]